MENFTDRRELSEKLRNLIKDIRQRLGYTQEQLASALGVGIVTIKRYETGVLAQTIPIEFLVAISKVSKISLGTIVNDLFGLNESWKDELCSFFAGLPEDELLFLRQALRLRRDSPSDSQDFLVLFAAYVLMPRMDQLTVVKQTLGQFLGFHTEDLAYDFDLEFRKRSRAVLQRWHAQAMKEEEKKILPE